MEIDALSATARPRPWSPSLSDDPDKLCAELNLLEETQLLTVGEVALRLRQSERTVRDKIAAGVLPAIKIGSGPRAPIRIRADELEHWLFAAPPSRRGGFAVAGRPARGENPERGKELTCHVSYRESGRTTLRRCRSTCVRSQARAMSFSKSDALHDPQNRHTYRVGKPRTPLVRRASAASLVERPDLCRSRLRGRSPSIPAGRWPTTTWATAKEDEPRRSGARRSRKPAAKRPRRRREAGRRVLGAGARSCGEVEPGERGPERP